MSDVLYACCDEERKAAVLRNPTLNGIDYLEVVDHDAVALGSPRQRTLLVHFLNPLPATISTGNVLIIGGESITDVGIEWVAVASDSATTPPAPPKASPAEAGFFGALWDAANVLVVRTTTAGDFSPYVFRLVRDASTAREAAFDVTNALAGFDPALSAIEFSFEVECGPDFDCAPPPARCASDLPVPPAINYLAKDYDSFRTVLLDRLNQLLPAWGASSEADMGVMMSELVAYVSDHLSYRQDAIATEAYIETARSRISLRRHALLVDYMVHDGCNARAWMHLTVNAKAFLDRRTTRFYTFGSGMPPTLRVGDGNEEAALRAGVVAFEPMQDAILYPEHNVMQFYTWGDRNCCLPRGATEATLLGAFSNLQPGDVLIFQEAMGPRTGIPADANLLHRCAVRLTQVTTTDASGAALVDPLLTAPTTGDVGEVVRSASQTPVAITEIQWSTEDALPFPVCLSSSFIDATGKLRYLIDVSIVLGNNVLADQGLRLGAVALGTVPEPSIDRPDSGSRCDPTQAVGLPVRFGPWLSDSPVTQAVPLPLAGSPVTPDPVSLTAMGLVSLEDANGSVALSVRAQAPWNWPELFGIETVANATHPGNIDLSVVYAPTGGAAGTVPPGPVVVERFVDLSLNSADPNYVVTQVNAHSRFVQVPTSFVPTGTAPTAFPASPTMLPVSGPIDLVDGGGATYLTVEPTNPIAWPPRFAVIAQGIQSAGNAPDEAAFNLLLVYRPPGGDVGVSLPVLVERFGDVGVETVASAVEQHSGLIRVKSFSDEPNAALSARALTHYAAHEALPQITLTGTFEARSTVWTPRPNLLQSGPDDSNFVVEVENDGRARVRFGDFINGAFPSSGTAFTADCRVGNGTDGNVGADTLIHFDADDGRIQTCTNPMAASGGTDPETAAQIRRRAPVAFLTQERAVRMADYEDIVARDPGIDRSVVTLRWTGSWYTVFISAEPVGGGEPSFMSSKRLTQVVDRYRLAGQDLQLEGPQYVSLEIELTVCVDPDYFRDDVRVGLLQVLGSATQPDGRPGLFAPDTFAFGQTVYLSTIYAAARQVVGVDSVTATVFGPQGSTGKSFIAAGEIPLGPLQLARMDNDPSFPGHGRLTLRLLGGK